MTYTPFDFSRAESTARRTLDFYNGGRGKAQIHIKSCRSLRFPAMPPLNSFSFPQDMESYLDLRAQRDIAYAAFHAAIDDDMIPSTAPWYGIAEHTAFLGGKVDFTADTTFQHKICDEIDDFRKISLDRDNLWIHLVVDGIRYLQEKWGTYIPIRMRGADGPSDVANAMRDSDLFFDIYDEPETLAELMSFCAKAINFTFDLQRPEATSIAGGVLNGFNLWMPGKCIGQISEDFSTMISPDTYEEHFFPALKETVAGCDMAMLHVHSLGQKMIPMFASVDQIKLMELSSDPNCDRAVEVFRKYHDVLQDKVVIVAPTWDELKNMGDLLESSKTIVWYYAEDEADIRRAMDFMEKYR